MSIQTLLYIGGRLLKGLLVLFVIAIFNFFLIRAAPGDPAKVMAGEAGAADEVFLQQLREQFGLDQPLYYQLWVYISNLVQFDMGETYRQQMPVFDLIMDRLPATLLLTGTAFIISLALGIFLGVIAASNHRKFIDSAISIGAIGVLRHSPILARTNGSIALLSIPRLATGLWYGNSWRQLRWLESNRGYWQTLGPTSLVSWLVFYSSLFPDDPHFHVGDKPGGLCQNSQGQGNEAQPGNLPPYTA